MRARQPAAGSPRHTANRFLTERKRPPLGASLLDLGSLSVGPLPPASGPASAATSPCGSHAGARAPALRTDGSRRVGAWDGSAIGECDGHGVGDLLTHLVADVCSNHELEQHTALELLDGVDDLCPCSGRSLPFRMDPAARRALDVEVGVPEPALPCERAA